MLFCDDDRLPDPVAAVKALLKSDRRSVGVVVRARTAARRAEIAEALARLPLTLLIAGDMGLARRFSCGLHLPEARAGEITRWRALSPAPVTLATHNMSALTRAARFGATAAFLSPVFPSQSHPGAPALGLMRAISMARGMPLPVFALGGIEPHNTPSLSGFSGIAAIGALIAAPVTKCQKP